MIVSEIISDLHIAQRAFGIPLADSKVPQTIKKIWQQCKWIIGNAVFEPIYKFKRNETANCLCYYNLANYRPDHIRTFCEVAGIIPNADTVIPLGRPPRKISLKRAAQSICALYGFFAVAKRNRWSIINQLYCLASYIQLYHFEGFLKSIDFKKYSAVITFCDAEICTNILTERAKQQGCVTATLQHGIFIAPKAGARNMDESGVELKGFASDYFLAWNEFTKQQAMQAGISPKKIAVVGNPKFFGCTLKKQQIKTNFFGVILGWIENDTENKKMIAIANEISQKLKMPYYLKYHPSFSGDEYTKHADSAWCAGCISKGATLEEYVQKTDFSIVGNSSLFVELMFLGQPTYHLHIIGMPDKYEAIHELSFVTAQELVDLRARETEISDELLQYLCGPENPKQEYQMFLQKIGAC